MANVGPAEFLLVAWSLLGGAVGLGVAIVIVLCVWRATKALERIALALEISSRPKA